MFSPCLLETGVSGPDISWLLPVALGFFILMVVVGWLASRRRAPELPPEKPARHAPKKKR